MQAGAIFVHDLRRNAVERLPTLSAATNTFSIWLADGTTVIYRSGVGVRVQSTESGALGQTTRRSDCCA